MLIVHGPAASSISNYPSISTCVDRQSIDSDSFHLVGHSKFARQQIELHMSNILYMLNLHLIIVWNSKLIFCVLELLPRAYLSVGSTRKEGLYTSRISARINLPFRQIQLQPLAAKLL
jgi:hypothetical protein